MPFCYERTNLIYKSALSDEKFEKFSHIFANAIIKEIHIYLFLHSFHSQNKTFVVKLLVYLPTYLYVEIVVYYMKPREESTFHREKAFCGHILHNTIEILSHTLTVSVQQWIVSK